MSDVTHFPAEAWARLGHAVRRRRIALGWTQKDLADRAELGVNTITNIEAGKKAQELNLGKLEKALGWSAGSYFDVLEAKQPTVLEEPEPAKFDGVIYERPGGLSDADWLELKSRLDADYELYKRLGGGN